MRTRVGLVFAAGLAVVALAALPVRAQLPLATAKQSGQTVTPAYEGWYKNADGTFSLSFGYLNRNAAEVVEIPVGPNNFITPGAQNQGQPTEFQPRRHWGVFAVKVPGDFGLAEVVWTIRHRGTTYEIPGRLHPNWQIDALEGEAGAGNTPPVLKFSESGPEARGPLGHTAGPLTASMRQPYTLVVWASDDGRSAASIAGARAAAAGGRGAAAPTVSLAFFKHQGPGTITFTPPTGRGAASGSQVTTSVTFSEPGDYVVRVRANDSSGVAGAGHAQCCWTNGFVKIAVSR